MKIILRFFAFSLFLLICIIVLANISNTITLETSFLSLKVNVGFLILLCVIAGSLGTLLFSTTVSNKDKLKKQIAIDNEKLNREIESDKVKQLQAKINTLEEALKIATRK